jgi:protein-S-isoprenylcysteine O-methyltransferase Ste14
LFGVVSYAVFFATFLYGVGFLGNFLVPKSIDSGAEGPLGIALLINGSLLLLFGLQHSVMARPGFKRWWTKFVPETLERPVYVLASSVAMILMFWLWRPMGGTIWHVENPIGVALLYGIFAAGWLIILVATFLINHFDLFGLRQVWLYFRGKEYSPLNFAMPWPYRVVRHPLYVGWLTTFWATPTMTIAHLVFAIGTTAYILVAIRFEERDLVTAHGAAYASYRQRVPMLIPGLKGRSKREPNGKPLSTISDDSAVIPA